MRRLAEVRSMCAIESLGLGRMDDEAIRDFLESHSVGVLGLPSRAGPYLVPMSFALGGADSLYFTYVGEEDSRKRRLSERADTARFLVYDAPSQFVWESVMLTGTLERVPEAELDDVDRLADGWRPAVVESAVAEDAVTVYRFETDSWDGVRQTGLPPGFTEGTADEVT